MRARAESFAKYHDEHARYGGSSRDFHALAGTFLRDLAEQHDAARARVAALETALLDACREKVVHGHTTTIWVEATRLEVPGVKELGIHADQLRSEAKTLVFELVEALEGLVKWGEAVRKRAGVRMGDPHTGALDAARAALEKAKGGTS